MTHTCVGNLTIIGSDNGLSPGRRQAIIWTNAEISLIGLIGTDVSEILTEIYTFLFKKMHLKMSSAKWRPYCLVLNVLMRTWCQVAMYSVRKVSFPYMVCHNFCQSQWNISKPYFITFMIRINHLHLRDSVESIIYYSHSKLISIMIDKLNSKNNILWVTTRDQYKITLCAVRRCWVISCQVINKKKDWMTK